jgi:tRNA(Ile)-lysidine synthase
MRLISAVSGVRIPAPPPEDNLFPFPENFPVKKFRQKVVKTIEHYSMLEPGDHVMVAISGGPDSVALASVLLDLKERYDLRLSLAHLHHGVRPREADIDMEFVRGLAEKWNLPLLTGYARLGSARKSPGSLEEIMRERRYAFLERARKKLNTHRIALGHQADDVAETLLINLLRGSAISGLASIPPAEGNLIRPLIHCTRNDILEYLERKNLAYRVDSSNMDLQFLRNRIRHELMPLLTQYNPGTVATLLRTAQSFRELDEFLAELAKDKLASMTKSKKGRLEISLTELASLPQALRVMILRQAIREQKKDLRAISRSHLLDVDSIATGSRPNAIVSLPGKMIAERSYSRLILCKKEKQEAAPAEAVRLKIPGKTRIKFPGLGPAFINVSLVSITPAKAMSSSSTKRPASLQKIIENSPAFLDKELLPDELYVRPFNPGDRIQPLGMKGRRKLKEIFMEMKVPPGIRKTYPVLASKDQVIWVPGYRIAGPYRITSATKRAIKISLKFER